MDSSTATTRPKVRIAIAAAALAGAAGVGWIATAEATHLEHARAALVASLIAGLIISAAALLAERQTSVARSLAAIADRQGQVITGQRQVVRELGRVRVVDRDHEALGAALLAHMRQICAHHGTIAAALDENNVRWERRQAEVYKTGYMDGMRRRGPDDPPALRSV